MLFNLTSLIVFDPANIASLMNIEMLQYQVNVVPDNGYDITDLPVLLGMILYKNGMLCIAQGGVNEQINGIIVNNLIHTLDPNLISSICSIFLN